MTVRKIYLVPGFFGFTSLGALNYFHRVDEAIVDALDERGLQAEVVHCRTRPTGSIRYRADALLNDVIRTGGLEADELHFVGHSTGGLDVRLLVTPGVRLRPDDTEERIGERVRSVISISTPHFGTPLANFFTTVQGRHVLAALTMLASTQHGRTLLFAASQLVGFVAEMDDLIGRRATFLDAVSKKVLGRVTLEEDDPLWTFVHEVSTDQGAIIQLTPEGMNLYNAAVTDRPGVDYRCVITSAPRPSARSVATAGGPDRLVLGAAFAVLHRLTAREHRHYPYPSPARELQAAVQRQLPFPLDGGTNDGIVPALSQLYGEVLHVAVADHLDVVGQFRYAGGDALSDWLPSGSEFDQARFRRVWRRVADAVAAASPSATIRELPETPTVGG